MIPTGKRKGLSPSVASIYRALAEREKTQAYPEAIEAARTDFAALQNADPARTPQRSAHDHDQVLSVNGCTDVPQARTRSRNWLGCCLGFLLQCARSRRARRWARPAGAQTGGRPRCRGGARPRRAQALDRGRKKLASTRLGP